MDKAQLIRLKELAEKATPAPWEVRNDISYIVTTGNPSEVIGWHWPDKNVFECNVEANSNYIAAANPQAILELIADYERLEKENEELRANNYGPEILNDPAALTVSYFAGRMAEGRERNAREDKLLDEKERLEKEANWLANKLVAASEMLANATGMETDDLNEAGWRKVAREAVEKNNGSN